MQSLDSKVQAQVVKKTAWLLCAVAINALEFFVPRLPFFPWLKPGLANIITILWIVEFGAIDAVLYALLRTWIVGFYFGFSFLTMSLAVSGGVLSAVVMGIAWQALGKKRLIGTVGLGIIGALFHNAGQLIAMYGFMAANLHLFFQVPVMLAASVVFGGMVGALAPAAYDVLEKAVPLPQGSAGAAPRFSARPKDRLFSLVLLAGCMAIVCTDSVAALCLSAAGASLIVQIIRKGSMEAFVKPLSGFWVLFVFVACVNFFFSYGARIENVPFLTREGLHLTLLQWLRLWTWLQVSFILSHFNFHSVVLHALGRAFRGHGETLFAGVCALEYFPAIAEDSRTYARNRIAALFSSGKLRAPGGEVGVDTQKGIARWAAALYGIVITRMEEKTPHS
jgi:heptaprenyl diphosphate synthase